MKTYSFHYNKIKYPAAIITSNALFILLVSGSLYYLYGIQSSANALLKTAIFFQGWVIWTLAEYIIHRFWEHDAYAKPNLKSYHHHHHRNPGKIKVTGRERLLMFVTAIIFTYISFIASPYLIIIAGFYSGFALFCFIHYFLHKQLSAIVFPHMYKMHIYHHTKFPRHCFGVTTCLWDYIFNSMPPAKIFIANRAVSFYHGKVHVSLHTNSELK